MKTSYLATLTLLTMLISACSYGPFVKGTRITNGAPAAKDNDGVFYALPRGYARAVVSRKDCVLSVAAPDPMLFLPDADARFRVTIAHDWLSQETLNVVTNSYGLLSTVTGTAEDKSAEVLKGAVKLVALFHGVPAKGRPGEQEEPPKGIACEGLKPAEKKKLDFSYNLFVDPTEDPNVTTGTIAQAAEDLKRRGVVLVVRPLTDQSVAADASKLYDVCRTALCFRALVPYQLEFKQTVESPYYTTKSKRVLLTDFAFKYLAMAPDPRMTFAVNLNRSMFASATTTLAFTDGVLTTYNATRPSEAVAAVQVPVDVGSAIAAIPGQLLTVKVTEAEAERALLAKQTELLNAQTELAKALKGQADAKTAPQQPPAQ